MCTPGNAGVICGAYIRFRKTSYFRALDGLRALSIGLVLLHHAVLGPQLAPALRILQENGRYGVGFFFLISGFLISTLLLREEAVNGEINVWRFYGRRALRLFPLYYGMLLFASVLVFGLHQYSPANRELFREKLPSYLFYYSNWLPSATQGPFFCAWSLAVEEQFYITFALLLCFVRRRTVVLAVAAALVLKVAVYWSFGPVDAHSQLLRVLFSYREPILIGVLVGFILHDPRGFALVHRWISPKWLTMAAGVAALICLTGHRMRHESAPDADILYLLMTVVLIGLVVRPNSPGVSSRLAVHIGRISYGIYLLHVFVIGICAKLAVPLGSTPVFLLSTLLTIILASLIYHYFEQPISAFYKRRLSAVSRAAPGALDKKSEREEMPTVNAVRATLQAGLVPEPLRVNVIEDPVRRSSKLPI